jgi:hypothetical protein
MFNSNKNKIRFIIYKKNRQVIQKKVEPKSNSFTYNGNSYIIDKENFYIWKNIATYSYREEVPIPLALKEQFYNNNPKLKQTEDNDKKIEKK